MKQSINSLVSTHNIGTNNYNMKTNEQGLKYLKAN